jgi:Zn-finger nucleic acid-binding protein
MKCPTCPDDRLVMTERSGIEIDYCPTCRGVWLDRGELDKIIERSSGGSAVATFPAPTGAVPARAAGAPPLRDDRDDRYDYDNDGYDNDRFDGDRFDGDRRDGGLDRVTRRPRKRRESLLSELFDF